MKSVVMLEQFKLDNQLGPGSRRVSNGLTRLTFVGLLKFPVGNSGVTSASVGCFCS